MNRSRVTGDLASHGNIFVDIANDRVGIGSTIPGEKLSLPDNAKIALGDSADLKLYHSGSHSFIDDTGTGNLYIQSNHVNIDSKNGEQFINCVQDGAVELYHNNTKKFETTANGAAISNIPNNQGLDLNGTGNNTGIRFMSTGSSPAHSYRVNFHSTTGGLFNSPCLSFDKTATNGTFSDHIAAISDDGFHLADNKKLHLGGKVTSGDFQIYHNGSHSFIDDIGTGNLKVRSNNFRVSNTDESKVSATFQPAASVELYENGTKVFETASFGVNIVGGFVASGDCSIADKITHDGDLNTAIRFPAADTFSVETAGSERLRITSNGRVGINSTSPTVPFDVVGSGKFSSALTVGGSLSASGTCTLGQTVSINGTNPRLQFVDSNHDPDFSIYGNNARFVINDDTNSAERFRIDSTGHTTIYSGTHDKGLDIFPAGNSQETRLRIQGKNSSGTEHTFNFNAKQSANRLDISGTGPICFIGSQNVGVHNAVPTSPLHVGDDTNPHSTKALLFVGPASGDGQFHLRGGSPTVFFDNSSGGNAKILTDNAALAISNGTLDSNGTELLRIDSSGRLLVGAAAIQYHNAPFYASGTGPVIAAFHSSSGGTNDQARIALGALANNPPYNRGVYLTAENNGAGHDFLVACSVSHAAGPSEKLRIKSDGKINVGNAISSDPWSRTGNTNTGVRLAQTTTGYAISANSNDIVAIFNRTSGTGNGTILELKYDNVVVASLGSSANSFAKTITIDSSASASLGLNRANTSSGAVIDFKTNGSVKWYMGLRGLVNDNFYIRNESGSTDALTILTNGRVGVNHTAPTAPLDVKGADDGINIRSNSNDRPHLNMINGSTTMLRISCNGSVVDFGDANSTARYMTFDPESDHSIVRMNAQTYVKSPIQRSSVYYHGAGFQYRDDSNTDHPVLHVQATSNGGGVSNIVVPNSKVVINGKSIGGSGRSWKLTVIKGSGSNIGQVIHHQTYDVYGNGTSEATNYVNALSTYTTNNNLIIVTTSDEPSSHANSIRTALRDTYGAKDSMYNYFRYAYVFAFRHGYGTLGEQNSIYWSALNTRTGGGQDNLKSVAAINFTVCL